jgi:Cu/Ag efflux pump CusA
LRRGVFSATARNPGFRSLKTWTLVVEGAAARVRPLVMTVATTVLGLLPLLWEAGVGADVSARTAAPVVGGLWSCMVLTLILPAAYAIWRRRQVRIAMPATILEGVELPTADVA